MFLAQRRYFVQKLRLHEMNAAFGLNHFQHNACCIGPNRSLKRLNIMKFHGLKALRKREEAFLHLILSGCCKRCECTSVE
ncbi:hypothetical protein D3C72_1069230 [compost metagenome]